jgi:hypothetical protein
LFPLWFDGFGNVLMIFNAFDRFGNVFDTFTVFDSV